MTVCISSLLYDGYFMTSDISVFSAIAVTLFQIYPKLTVAIFCITGSSITMMFKLLKQKIQELPRCSESDFFAQLDKCRCQHVSIVNLIHSSDVCFGAVLLVEISSKFLEIINGSFYSYLNWRNCELAISDVIYPFFPMIEISLICYVAHQIQITVSFFITSWFIRLTILFHQAAEISCTIMKLQMTKAEHQREVKNHN